MHSSRMRTGRSLTVCRSLLWGGGVCSRGSAPRGVSAQGCLLPGGGCLLLLGGGVCSRGRVWYPSMYRGRHPPCEQNDKQCKNITLATIVAGKNLSSLRNFYCSSINVFILCIPGYEQQKY